MPQYTVELLIRELFEVEAESEEEAKRLACAMWELGDLVEPEDCECWLEDDEQS